MTFVFGSLDCLDAEFCASPSMAMHCGISKYQAIFSFVQSLLMMTLTGSKGVNVKIKTKSFIVNRIESPFLARAEVSYHNVLKKT